MQNGGCYQPNTKKDHCNYAVNSYFQRKNQINGSCDFTGSCTVTSTLTSSNTNCVYPASPRNHRYHPINRHDTINRHRHNNTINNDRHDPDHHDRRHHQHNSLLRLRPRPHRKQRKHNQHRQQGHQCDTPPNHAPVLLTHPNPTALGPHAF
ncbi:hypothetical protein C3L33_14132, partial [Rhododendron williamsianum]